MTVLCHNSSNNTDQDALGHDVRNALTVVKSAAWMLNAEMAGELNERQHELVRQILGAVESIERMAKSAGSNPEGAAL